MHLAHIHHFVERLATASVITRMLTDPSSRSGQGIVENHRLECIFQPALLIKLKKARNVHPQRATVLARRKREFLADACAATMGNDVVFVFLAEVAHGGEHGIGCRLAQRAERALANHPSQFIQQVHLFTGSAALSDRIEDAQRFVQPHPAWNAFAA